MESVRAARTGPRAVLHRESWSSTRRPPAPLTGADPDPGVPVLDVIYLVATLALFALVGLIAKAVEKL
jgi:hypothetical protein